MSETKKTLRDVVPQEFFREFMTVTPRSWVTAGKETPSPAAKLLDVEVVREHSRVSENESFMEWPGSHLNVHVWWELANGKAVAWNENMSKGWSFPVISYKESK